MYLANYLMPSYYELGNMNFTPMSAGLVAGFALTVVGFVAKTFAKGAGLTKRGRYPMFLYYGFANSAGIWVIARVADLTGFGISRFYWAILLGFLASLTHWLVRQGLKKSKLL
ncbi:MAG: hypothetical protein US62_C0003G0021 [Candidatus Woesebacteria bacterium GW2011_GWA1_37_8]|uniref:Uncharacterized protein n=2 Tax=Candidatus Woeseibacteriota TaxID=1752722 RepID=A0A0G0PEQ6_9BACT|nr:MAG: hypothetical protein US39_C0010G0020 [Microgenomates group bacterium GW2011_GWC1_37_12b]KKQ46272.1 MAG: hypothetical protein US62_C0003G0021 [Candidatus Woesebacteria bacterium GW2011_GWA1_37_8]KKQ87766.1 MAG: hypothetical protein UT10_C0001G0007 [Candidatus Woesebacteria bacterium GW2011_GWB1_38_8b]